MTDWVSVRGRDKYGFLSPYFQNKLTRRNVFDEMFLCDLTC